MSGRLHTIVALVENRPGVLNKIASKWRQRGFNIEASRSATADPGCRG
jgi:acetolactate synthase-1/3 small subunit